MRCWNCGNKNCFTEKRTFRAKAIGVTAGVATLGVAGAVAPLATKKKLKCQLCSEYNDTGSVEPFTGPASKKWRKIHEKNGNRCRSRLGHRQVRRGRVIVRSSGQSALGLVVQ